MIKKLVLVAVTLFNFGQADAKLLACLCPCFFNKKPYAPVYTSRDYHDHVGKRYIRISISGRDKKNSCLECIKNSCCFWFRKKQA